jgi:tetratricopeptide (TPR) repeat protein
MRANLMGWLGAGLLFAAAAAGRAEPIEVKIDVESLQLPKEFRQDVDEIDQAVKSFRRGDAEQALTLLRAASRKYENLPPPRLLLARLYLARQQVGPARASLEQAAVESPDYPEIYVLFGGLALYEGRLADAWLHYEMAESLVGRAKLADAQKAAVQKGLYSGKAAVAARRQDWPRAEAALSDWLALDGKNGQARQLLGVALFHQGKRDEARAALEQAATDDPTLGPAAVTLGQLYTEQGDIPKAAERMERAVRDAPGNVKAHLGYARWLMDQDQPEKARSHAETAARLDASSGEVRALRGWICWHLHEYEAAEPIFQALHDESPGNFEFHNYLALSLAEQSKPKQLRALELAEINARLHPNSPEALATLGRVYDRLGRAAEAEHALRTATTRGTVSADAVYWLARVLAARGQGEEAGKMLRLALDTKGAFASRKEAAALLDQVGRKP